MEMYDSAENYIQLNLPRMLSELTKDDKESYALNINVFKIPFRAENTNFFRVYITVKNIKLEHKQAFLDILKESFGLDSTLLTEDADYVSDESGFIFGNFNLAYRVPIALIEKLAVLYKIAI